MAPTELTLRTGRHAFGADPELYAAARPDYPDAVYEVLLALGRINGARIFEVGPGTGLATARLLDHQPALLAAIEPDERLAAYLRRTIGARFPPLAVLQAPFEDARLPPDSFDLGVAATSFHWLEQKAALTKAVTLLRPQGWWAMWWNIFGDPDDPDAFAIAARPLFQALDSSPSWPSDGRRPFALDADSRLHEMQAAGLRNTEFWLRHWTLTMDTVRIRALAATFSQVSQADPRRRSEFLEALGRLADEKFGGMVERRFLTAFYSGQKPLG